jgi:hypothetical protein
MTYHPLILAEFRREHGPGEPTWIDLLQAAGRVIDALTTSLDNAGKKVDK